MKPEPVIFTQAMEQQAASWAMKIANGLTGTDHVALAAWLEEDPAHRVLLSQYCQLSADLEQQLPAMVAAGVVEMPRAEIAPRRFWPRMTWAAAAAAVVALLFWWAPSGVDQRSVATAPARRQSLTLADGTRAELNAQTYLVLDVDRSHRRVELLRGEALFKVTKDPARPFVVKTPAGAIRVTGTLFNVRAVAADRLEVTVVEGSVEVRPGAAGAESPVKVLKPGQQLILAAGEMTVSDLSAEAVEDVMAWRVGRVVFDGETLREVASRVGQYHDRVIVVAPEVAGMQLGGRYSLEDFDGFIAALEKALPIRATRDPDGVVRLAAR